MEWVDCLQGRGCFAACVPYQNFLSQAHPFRTVTTLLPLCLVAITGNHHSTTPTHQTPIIHSHTTQRPNPHLIPSHPIPSHPIPSHPIPSTHHYHKSAMMILITIVGPQAILFNAFMSDVSAPRRISFSFIPNPSITALFHSVSFFWISVARSLFNDRIATNFAPTPSFEKPGMRSSMSVSVGVCTCSECVVRSVGAGRGFLVGGVLGLAWLLCTRVVVEWKSLFGGLWMCMPRRAVAAFARGMWHGLANMLVGRLNSMKPSGCVDRTDMVQLIATDGMIRGLALEQKHLSSGEYCGSWHS